MLAERNVHGRAPIVDRQLLVGHRACEDEPVVPEPVLAHQRANRRIVPRHGVVPADEDEAIVRVHVALVMLGELDVILDLLVRRDPSDEQEIQQAVVEQRLERRSFDLLRDARHVDRDGKHRRAREPQVLELEPIELRVAQREIDVRGERREHAAANRGEPEQARIVRREVRRRRDVVVLQHAA